MGRNSFFHLALLILLLSACENDIEKVKLVTDRKDLPTESSKGLEILYSDSARVKVKIIAPEMNRLTLDQPVTELPKGLDVEFYDNNLNVISTLTAKYAIRHDAENIMEARNNVVVVNSKNEKLNTEHLVWNERSAKIYSDEFVKITTPDKIIFGNGFEANQDFTNYRIYKIKGTITINKDEHTQDP